ncbi:hypothetical protein VTK26DRAFT_5018 [Humicola hyalothermophila]
MALVCFCTPARWVKARSRTAKDQRAPASPPPLARPPGPLTLNPVTLPVSTAAPHESPLPPRSPTSPTSIAAAPVEPAELDDLVVDDSDTEDDCESSFRKQGPGPLERVRSRLRRRLSQDSLSRRKSRTSVGTSPQEIERRAELKRLMHKRIQDELHDEEVLAALHSDTSSSYRLPDNPAIDYSPVGGPRDTIEFSVTGVGSQASRHSKSAPISSPNVAHDITGGQASSPESELQPESHVHQSHTLAHAPSTPALPLKHQPSSSLGSWRPSFSAEQLSELIFGVEDDNVAKEPVQVRQATPPLARTPSPQPHSPCRARSLPRSHSSPASARPHSTALSPLRTWLRSQGLGSRPPSSLAAQAVCQDHEQEADVQQAEIVYLRRWNSAQNNTILDIGTRRSGIIHLYDMDIHHQLATQTLNSPAESSVFSDFRRPERGRSSGSYQSYVHTLNPRHDSRGSLDESPGDVASGTNDRRDSTTNGFVLSSGGASLYSTPDGPDIDDLSPTVHVPTADSSERTQGETDAEAIQKSTGHFDLDNSGPPLLVERFHQTLGPPRSTNSSRPSPLAWLQPSVPRRLKSMTRNGAQPCRAPLREKALNGEAMDYKAVQGGGAASKCPPHNNEKGLVHEVPVLGRASDVTAASTIDTVEVQQAEEHVPHRIPSKLGKAVNSSLGRLVTTRALPARSFSDPLRRRRRRRRGKGYPGTHLGVVLDQGLAHLGSLRRSSCPLASQPMAAETKNYDNSKIALSPRMAALLHGGGDGTSDSDHAGLGRQPGQLSWRGALPLTLPLAMDLVNPAADLETEKDGKGNDKGRKVSTVTDSTNNRFVTPLSSFCGDSNSNEESSFHSCPHSVTEEGHAYAARGWE